MKKKNFAGAVEDAFEAARKAFFSGHKGDAAASPRRTCTQGKSCDGPAAGCAAPENKRRVAPRK